jgi:hypothetical protein
MKNSKKEIKDQKKSGSQNQGKQNEQQISYLKIMNGDKEYITDDQDEMYLSGGGRIIRTSYGESSLEKLKSKIQNRIFNQQRDSDYYYDL